MIYGYARCSTNENKQDIERQLRELKAAGVDTVIWEYEHGDSTVKAQFDSLLDNQAVEGDTIVVTEVSRISRSTKQLCGIIDLVRDKRLKLVIIGSISVDCTKGQLDPMTAAFLQMAGVFAELELQLIRSRVRSGMANAKAKGKQIGRPGMTEADLPPIFSRYLPLYQRGEITKKALAQLCGVSYPTVYRYLTLTECKD